MPGTFGIFLVYLKLEIAHVLITQQTQKTWRCASAFLKMLTKLKITATGQLHNFLGAQKLKSFRSEIIKILQSYSQRFMEMWFS